MDINEPLTELSGVHQGRNITAFRSFNGLTQKEFAKLMNMSQQSVSDLEKMQIVPEETLMQAAQVLGVDVDILKNYTSGCQLTIIKDNEFSSSDSSPMYIEGKIEGNNETNYNADKALEVIETVVNNQNTFVDYLKGEIESLKKEINLVRLENKGLMEQMKKG